MATHEPKRPARADVEVNGRSARLPFHRFIRASLVVAAVAAVVSPAAAQTVDPNLYVPNSTVFSSAVSGNTLYLGGQFTRLGVASGAAVPFDATSGLAVPGFPKVAGTINAIAPDGAGGWFIGGAFSQIGGIARANAAHILADYSVDPAWIPAPNGSVNAIAVSGSTVYLGGGFTNVGGQARNRAAAVDAVSGAVGAWNPDAGSGPLVQAIAVDGSVVYLGGTFTTMGGQSRNRIAAVDAATGALQASWNANLTGTSVRAIVVSGPLVYVGGQFTVIGGQPRNRIAALNAADASATPWDPDANSNVFALAVDGSTVYAGGLFTAIGRQTRYRVAALDTGSGDATSWSADLSTGFGVNALAVAGSQVIIGGNFPTVGGVERNSVAAVDVTFGTVSAWNPSPCGPVNALAVTGSTVYVGGQFVCMYSVPRLNLAAIDLTTGMPTSWRPDPNGTVQSLVVGGDGTVYAGGIFAFAGGQPRSRIAALDPVIGNATFWNPNADGAVTALAVDGSTVYAGGAFGNIGGAARSRIAAIDAVSGGATLWNPGADNAVNALALGGGVLYAGGTFMNVGGQPRQRLAAIDATGSVMPWNPGADNTVNALALGGGTLHAGGGFMVVGGQGRQRIAAIDAATGTVTGWNPGADNTVQTLALDGPVLYMGGLFTNVLGPRNRAAAVLTGSGHPAPWDPNLNAPVNTLALGPSGVIIGGSFSTVGGAPRATLASVSRQQAHAITASAGPGGAIQPAGVVGAFDGAFQGFTITPDAGYIVTDVLVDGSSVGPVTGYTIGPVTSNRTIAASFGPNVRTLATSVSPGGAGSISLNPDQAVHPFGSVVELTAVPAPNYAFVEWTGDLTGNANPANIVMDANKTVVANFVYAGPPLSLEQGPGGSAETSEELTGSWFNEPPSPGTANVEGTHLLLTEFSVAPTGQEWVEITNPTAFPLDLSNFYLTNAFAGGAAAATQSYEVLPSGNFVAAAGSFCARFPAGTSIPAGGSLVIAVNGSGVDATYGDGVTHFEILPSSPDIPDMTLVGGTPPSPATSLFSDAAGFLMLFYWDGASDLVCDVDYVLWSNGTNLHQVSKSNRAVDGPDADLLASRYRPDSGPQYPLEPPAPGETLLRSGPEGFEQETGGNGCVRCTETPALITTVIPFTGGGSIARSPNQTVFNLNETVQLTAIPQTGRTFTGWGGDASGTQNPLTLTMDECKSVIALFQINSYPLNVSVVGPGTVTKTPDLAEYNHGTTVQLAATAPLGYSFTGWSGDATGTTNPLNVVMNGPKNITATFTLNTYALGTAVTGSGTLTRAPDLPLYDHGTTVELTATAAVGHTFTGWSGDTTGTTNPLTVMMNRAKTITANCPINTYALGVAVVGGGSVARSPNQTLYNHGTTVELTAIANTGYSFAGWSGDASGTDPTVNVMMDGTRQVTATFAADNYAISVSSGTGGGVARDPDLPLYEYGSVVEISAIPDPGFVFAGWEGDTTGFTNPLPVTVSGPKNISATFLDAANNLIVTGSFVVGSPATYDRVIVAESGLLTVNAPLNVNGDMTVRPGGRVTHTRGVLTGVQLNVGGRFWLQRSGAPARIDVAAKGLLGGSRSGSPCAPSIGQTYNALGSVTCDGGSWASGGGSYGGIGGIGGTGGAQGSPGASYGLAEDPSQLGSGGGSVGVYVDEFHAGGNGGGLVRIVADSVIIDGEILADGQSVSPDVPYCNHAYNHMGAGSGGGIKIVASVFRGGASAVIRANGGATYPCQLGGAGGGGRIAIWADDQTGYLGGIEARGGHLDAGFKVGSAGTLYRAATDGGGSSAELVVANGGRHSWAYTPLRTGRSALRAVRVRGAALLNQGGAPGANLTIVEDVRVEESAIHRLLAGASLAIEATGMPDLSVTEGARFIAYEGSSLALDQVTLTSSGELYSEIPLAFSQASDLSIAGGMLTVREAAVLTLPDLNPSNFSAGVLDIGADASLHVTGSAIRLAGTLVKSGRFGDGGVGTPDAITMLSVVPGGRLTHGQGVLTGLRLNARSIRIEAGGRIDVAAQGLLGGSRFAPGCDHRTGQTYDALGNVTCAGGSHASAGGSYGGLGGIGSAGGAPAATYGSAEDPAHLGSGGGAEGVYVDIYHAGGNGGGLVRIVADSVIIDGEVSADGESVGPTSPFCGHAYNGQAGGSGGGIKIAGGHVCGTGIIHARGGGTAPCGHGGGGGGGRIAISFGDLCFPAANLSVAGGGGGPSGGAGTIHLELNATADIAGSGSLVCDNVSQPAAGVTVNLSQGLTPVASTTTAADGSYAFADLPLGTYTVSVVSPAGYATPIDTRLVTVDEGDETVTAEAFPFTCLTGDIAGRVTGTCDGQTAGLQGVTVDVYRDDGFGTDVLVAVTGTDAGGYFQVDNLALGAYTVGIVTPLGYAGTPSQQVATLATPDGTTSLPVFALACQTITAQPRGMGYWKHQVNVYLTNKGHAQETLTQLLGYIDLMVVHFNQHVVNPVVVYVPGASTTNDKLLQLQQLLTVNRGGTALERAKQHLLALLLNVVSGKISQVEEISENAATVSQAITHSYDLIVDGDPSNDETAKDICELINDGRQVPPGMVPAGVPAYTYDPNPVPQRSIPLALGLGPIAPNPATAAGTITFALPTDMRAVLEIVDLAGRMVHREEVGSRGAGYHAVRLADVKRMPPGVYLVRLTQGNESLIKRLAVIR